MIHVVSGMLLIQAANVFMGRRPVTASRPGMWEMPGGKVEPGETPQQALEREWWEEIGISVEVSEHIATTFILAEDVIEVSLYRIWRTNWAQPYLANAHDKLQAVDPAWAIVNLACAPATYGHYRPMMLALGRGAELRGSP